MKETTVDNYRLTNEIDILKSTMAEMGINAEKGLGEDLFLMVSTMTPILNVDLFITDSNRRVLLSWRDDQYCGKGWHIPGGCLRFKERLEERIVKTAIDEIGTVVEFDPHPIKVLENIANDDRTVIDNNNIRAHFISLLYKCIVSNEEEIHKCDGRKIVGHLKWFDHVPSDFIEIQKYYIPILQEWFSNSDFLNVT